MRRRNKGGALQGVQLSQLHQQSSVAFICSVGVLIAWLVHLKGVHLSQVHQPSSMAIICLVGALIARLVYLKGVHLSQVHQPSSMTFICLVGVLIAWLVYLKGVQLSPLGFAACQSKKCTNRVAWLSFARLVYLLLGWCTYCLVGALLAWLVHLRQVHPLKLHLRKSTVSVRRPIRFRSPSDRIPSAVRSDSVRCPIGFRPPSNRIPFAVQSDSVRRPIRFRSPSDRIPFAVQ